MKLDFEKTEFVNVNLHPNFSSLGSLNPSYQNDQTLFER